MDANFWKIKKVLITGHTGFKGGWMASLLSALGAKIYGYSNERKQSPNAYEDWANQYKSSDYEVIDDLANLTKLKSFKYRHIAIHPFVQNLANRLWPAIHLETINVAISFMKWNWKSGRRQQFRRIRSRPS